MCLQIKDPKHSQMALNQLCSPVLQRLYSPLSCYWCTGPWRSLSPCWAPLTGLFYSYRGRQMLLSISLSRRTSFPVGNAPGLRIWILRVDRSTPTRQPAYPAAARTLGSGLFTAETRRPLPLYSSFKLSNLVLLSF